MLNHLDGFPKISFFLIPIAGCIFSSGFHFSSYSEESSKSLSCLYRNSTLVSFGIILHWILRIYAVNSNYLSLDITSNQMEQFSMCNITHFLLFHTPKGQVDLVSYLPWIRFSTSEEVLRGILPFPVLVADFFSFLVTNLSRRISLHPILFAQKVLILSARWILSFPKICQYWKILVHPLLLLWYTAYPFKSHCCSFSR